MGRRGPQARPPEERKQAKGLRLSPGAWKALEGIASERRITQAAVLEDAIQKEYQSMTYSVRRPISSDSSLDREGAVLSRHEGIASAAKAWRSQASGARDQGGYTQDYIWDDTQGCRVDEDGNP